MVFSSSFRVHQSDSLMVSISLVAPAPTRNSATSRWPSCVATIKAMKTSVLSISVFAPAPTRHWLPTPAMTLSRQPFHARPQVRQPFDAHTHTQTHTHTHTHFLCSLYLARHAGENVSTQANSHQALGNTIHTYSTVGATEEKPGSMNTGWGQTEYRRYV